MDKRIIKTKKALQGALISLLKEKDFEAIKTTEICEKAQISRNTFYSYYSDKYSLLKDCFDKYESVIMDHYDRLQRENNPEFDIKKSYLNLVDAFLDTDKVFNEISIFSDFNLMSGYYQALMGILEQYERRYDRSVNPNYNIKQLNSFLVLGFWGFIHEYNGHDKKDIRASAHKLILDLLNSPIFCLQ